MAQRASTDQQIHGTSGQSELTRTHNVTAINPTICAVVLKKYSSGAPCWPNNRHAYGHS